MAYHSALLKEVSDWQNLTKTAQRACYFGVEYLSVSDLVLLKVHFHCETEKLMWMTESN